MRQIYVLANELSEGIAAAVAAKFEEDLEASVAATVAATVEASMAGYALLGGRLGGQTLYGGADSGDDLVLASTSHATKGAICIAPGEVLSVGGTLTVADEKTDHQIMIQVSPGVQAAGAWAASVSSNVLIVTRTAAVNTGQYMIPIHLPARTAASKGAKLKSVTVCYTVGSADTTNDQLLVEILKQTMPADGSSPVGSILAGDADEDYNTGHNTKAARLATGTHTLTVTIPAGEQAYLASGEQLYLLIAVTDAATANLAFALKGVVADYNSSEY